MSRQRRTATPSMASLTILLATSGACALAYQVVWTRQLQDWLGHSTVAAAVVLAAFLGGLGAGSRSLGPGADASARPLLRYAGLEAGIAAAAAAVPALLAGGRALSTAIGLGATDGMVGATLVRGGLAFCVLGLPAFLMGGTLPAAVRAAGADASRARAARLYGANTLGAVFGCLLAGLVGIDQLGLRGTLLAAAGLNLAVAVIAWILVRGRAATREEDLEPPSPEAAGAAGHPTLALGAAAVSGFIFLLMELVWYRMLAPLLGGSSYTFTVVLATALLGIGTGGLLFAWHRRRTGSTPSPGTFAVTCAAEALALAIPWALGDRIAFVAMMLRPAGDLHFTLTVAVWGLISAVVVLPAALVAGYQFPLLLAVFGDRHARIGTEVGRLYAWNTAGAITGALVGGLLVLPWLGAVDTWRVAALLLVVLAQVVWLYREHRWTVSVLLVVTIVALTVPRGPSALWRHSPIGAGGMPSTFASRAEVEATARTLRRAVAWSTDGRESSIAIHQLDEVAVVVNGKADGSATKDAPTQVLSGLIGAALHPAPRRALVVGLGTGSSAGWLAAVPGMTRVDVLELEPSMVEVARRCAAVNQNVLEAANVHLRFGDARAALLAPGPAYDLIFSEPSNPYRAGVSSLFSRELYAAAARRLDESGLFLQWLQAYDVDNDTVDTVIVTLADVFPHVELWQVHERDLLLVASRTPIDHDLPRLRQRLAEPPFARAWSQVLGIEGVDGFYTGFLASAAFTRRLVTTGAPSVSTDDRPQVERGFVRNLGRSEVDVLSRLRERASAPGDRWPSWTGGTPDDDQLREQRRARSAAWGETTAAEPTDDHGAARRQDARNAWVRGDLRAAAQAWRRQDDDPETVTDRVLVAEALAEIGDPSAIALAEPLVEAGRPIEAPLIEARLAWRSGRTNEAVDRLIAGWAAARRHPWSTRAVLERSLLMAVEISRSHPATTRSLADALDTPFAVHRADDRRLRTAATLGAALDPDSCTKAFAAFEPHVPWEPEMLRQRARCYAAAGDPRRGAAQRDLDRYRAQSARW